MSTEGWTLETLYLHLQRQLDDMRATLQERYETQTKALDAAFIAQQIATQTALTAAENAVQTALISAEKAVTKAEAAADKRFESVNEFRAQLADQAATFISRTESDAKREALTEKLDSQAKHVNEFEAQVVSRLDLMQGKSTGVNASWGYLVGAVGLAGAVVALVLTFIK